jgi:hypothetical protein
MINFSRINTPESLIKDTVGVEVGVDQGEFSKVLLDKGPKKLYLVDAWQTVEGTDRTTGAEQSTHDSKYELVSEIFRNEPRVEIIRSWSEDASSNFEDGSLDWVYIDARHDYIGVISDLRAWSKKIKSTGFIWGDDYRTPDMKHKPRVDVRRAVADFTKETHWQLVGLTTEEKRSKSFFLAKHKKVIDRFKSLV